MKAMKVHGKRSEKGDPTQDIAAIQSLINTVRDNRLVPRGVYRFRSFEEADEWMMKQMVRLHARPVRKTS